MIKEQILHLTFIDTLKITLNILVTSFFLLECFLKSQNLSSLLVRFVGAGREDDGDPASRLLHVFPQGKHTSFKSIAVGH